MQGFMARPRRDARRARAAADPRDRRRRGARHGTGPRAVPRRRRSSASTCRTRSSPGTGGRPDLACVFGDATRLPVPDGAFDLVLAIEVLEHIPVPDAALAELARVCSGTLIASVPFEPIWRAGNLARGRYVRDFGNTPGHVNHWTRWGFTRFVSTRFRVERVRNPLPWTMVRAHPRCSGLMGRTKPSGDIETLGCGQRSAPRCLEVGADDVGDVEGEDLRAVLVEVEAVVGPDVLALPVTRVDDVLGPVAVAPREPPPRVDEDHVRPVGQRGAHGLILHLQPLGDLGVVVVGDADPDDRAVIAGEQVDELPRPPPVLRVPRLPPADRIGPLGRELAVEGRHPLGVVAAERDHDDVRVDLLQLGGGVRRPVEEVRTGQPRRDLVVDLAVDHAGVVHQRLEIGPERAGVAVADDEQTRRVVGARWAGCRGRWSRAPRSSRPWRKPSGPAAAAAGAVDAGGAGRAARSSSLPGPRRPPHRRLPSARRPPSPGRTTPGRAPRRPRSGERCSAPGSPGAAAAAPRAAERRVGRSCAIHRTGGW